MSLDEANLDESDVTLEGDSDVPEDKSLTTTRQLTNRQTSASSVFEHEADVESLLDFHCHPHNSFTFLL